MKREAEIIIVGAGLAGLGCALKLWQKGEKNFLIISEDIGGRVKTSPDSNVNYGAYYITKDCKTVMAYVDVKEVMRLSNYRFRDDNGKDYPLFSFKLLKHFYALTKLLIDLIIFRKHFLQIRKMSFEKSRKDLIEGDPLIKKYYHQVAGDYIKERGLESLVKDFLEQALWASFFVDCRTVPTFIFLQCLLPMITKTYSFQLRTDKIISPFEESVVFGSIAYIQKTEKGFVLKTKDGLDYVCKKLVLATPMTITNSLVSPQNIKKTIECKYFHIRGKLKPQYDRHKFNFFPVNQDVALSRELDGSYLYFYTKDPKIEDYFLESEIITSGQWKPALILLGDEYINLNPEKNLFLANDHDVASTEDAFINGMYTAKLVLES